MRYSIRKIKELESINLAKDYCIARMMIEIDDLRKKIIEQNNYFNNLIISTDKTLSSFNNRTAKKETTGSSSDMLFLLEELRKAESNEEYVYSHKKVIALQAAIDALK